MRWPRCHYREASLESASATSPGLVSGASVDYTRDAARKPRIATVTMEADPSPTPKSRILAEDCANLATNMAHLYRAEMQRMTVWRQRLDTTTQWAIILTTALTTFVLGSVAAPHFIMLLGLTLNAIFMVIEARRYQHLHHSKRRLALLERDYFAPQLADCECNQDWAARLAADLRHPHITISLFEATMLRLRRNYLMLAYFITAVWLTKLFIHPVSPVSLRDYYERFAVGDMLPPWFVVPTALIFVTASTVMALRTCSEEVLERWVKAGEAGCPLDR